MGGGLGEVSGSWSAGVPSATSVEYDRDAFEGRL